MFNINILENKNEYYHRIPCRSILPPWKMFVRPSGVVQNANQNSKFKNSDIFKQIEIENTSRIYNCFKLISENYGTNII